MASPFIALLALVTPLLAIPLVPEPPANAENVVYLVNCAGGSGQSAMAYYSDNADALKGSQPDAVALVGEAPFIHWEGQIIEGTFDNGITFTTNITDNVDNVASQGALVGKGDSDYKDFTCYKEFPKPGKLTLLFTDADLGACSKVYDSDRPQKLEPPCTIAGGSVPQNAGGKVRVRHDRKARATLNGPWDPESEIAGKGARGDNVKERERKKQRAILDKSSE
ncbi:hypothetical protein G7Y89_g5615 [Cudoniella acicularis]|uniref:Uncharacterized protein n=1 Tax=Cudoniella acicularis TaxID=354080 RepID=A0A8H4RQD3_9HELO|nr:hypothetical protein G7Y89_g5615 [Cudoniella acicularis]